MIIEEGMAQEDENLQEQAKLMLLNVTADQRSLLVYDNLLFTDATQSKRLDSI